MFAGLSPARLAALSSFAEPMGELIEGAGVLAPSSDRLAGFLPLFRRHGKAHRFPSLLLAAVAVELTGCDPTRVAGGHSGLMAYPGDDGSHAVANWGMLMVRNPEAARVVDRTVDAAAARLARLRGEHGLAAGLVLYCKAAGVAEPVEAARRIAGTYLVLTAIDMSNGGQDG